MCRVRLVSPSRRSRISSFEAKLLSASYLHLYSVSFTMDSLAPLRRRLTDVTEYQLPRLLSGKLSRELGAEARADLESVRQALELKREEAEGPPLDRELLEAVDIIQTELDEYVLLLLMLLLCADSRAMKKYRAALVTAKKASRAEKERYELDEPVEQVEHVDVEVIG